MIDLWESTNKNRPPSLGQPVFYRQSIRWMYNAQVWRSNISDFERIEVTEKLKSAIEAKAKERQLQGLKQNSTVVQTSAQGAETGNTREELAKL